MEERTDEEKVRDIAYTVLCQCGWGSLVMIAQDIPDNCPVCGFNFKEHSNGNETFMDDV